MFENVTIDKILARYSAIDSDKLSDDNIDIDIDLKVENSATKYLQLFAIFLNDYIISNNYYISESIFKRLMDIVDYEGYEYQIIQKYISILSNHKYSDNKLNVAPEDAKVYILEYLRCLQDNLPIPYFRHIYHEESNKIEMHIYYDKERSQLVEFKEVEYPIDFIYKQLKNDVHHASAEAMYILYKNNFPAFKNLVYSDYKYESIIYFLLDEEDDRAFDILSKIISLSSLGMMMKLYSIHCNLTETAANNIKKLIDIIRVSQ